MQSLHRGRGIAAALICILTGTAAAAQTAPAPSQVVPPVIAPAPRVPSRIGVPEVPAGAPIPAQAKKLTFVLTGIEIEGEFPELAKTRKALAAPLIGHRVSVAAIFKLAEQLQAAYVNAGYPLVRVVTLPQELGEHARVKLRVIDGFFERIDVTAINERARERVLAVVAPLVQKRHLTQAELERRLLLAGETPGLVLNAVFAAGKQVGGSLLVLTGRYRPVSASLYVDDAMPQTFGTVQAVTSVAVNNVAGWGDQLLASVAGYPSNDFFTHYPTRRYLTAQYSVPLGVDGWKAEVGATDGRTTPRVSTPDASTFGLLDQWNIAFSYAALKRRDAEITLSARFDATDERIDSLALASPVSLSLDRTRVIRLGLDGIWRGRETGTTISFGAVYSQGLDAFGARTAADATPLLPLSRAGADAKFSKLTGNLEVAQALPFAGLTTALIASGQTSFHRPMLTSEQFDLVGAKMLSGFSAGSFPGDTAWVVRSEIARPTPLPLAPLGATALVTPYLFAAQAERILWQPTVLEIASQHVSNYGLGLRFNLPGWSDLVPDSYAFVEGSRGYVTPVTDSGSCRTWRVFAGFLLQY